MEKIPSSVSAMSISLVSLEISCLSVPGYSLSGLPILSWKESPCGIYSETSI